MYLHVMQHKTKLNRPAASTQIWLGTKNNKYEKYGHCYMVNSFPIQPEPTPWIPWEVAAGQTQFVPPIKPYFSIPSY